MLGRDDPQLKITSLENLELWGKRPLVAENSFYGRMARADDVFRDELFADAYSGVGAPSIPPSRLIKALILQAYDDVSDREAENRALYDLRWKKALHLALDDAGFDYSTLSRFRTRLLLNGKDRTVFEEILSKALVKGFLKPGEITQVMDSTHVFGAGAVQDTYTLIKKSIIKLWKALGNGTEVAGLIAGPFKVDYQTENKPKIEWDDVEARKGLLNDLVYDARILLDAAAGLNLSPRQKQLYDVLAKVSAQDVEIDEDGRYKLKQGVAKDRIISTTDPDMRHGRKSSSKRIDGYKAHITMDSGTELVLGVEVTPANVHDSRPASDLLANQADKLKPSKVVGDAAYGTGDLRHELAQAQVEIIAPVPGKANNDEFAKVNFQINLEKETCFCPAGKLAKQVRKNRMGELKAFAFDLKQCQGCLFKDHCVKSKRGYRVVSVHRHEKELQMARAQQKSPEFRAQYNAIRPAVERKQAEAVKHGLRHNSYIGRAKARLHAILVYAAVNFRTLCELELKAAKPLTQVI